MSTSERNHLSDVLATVQGSPVLIVSDIMMPNMDGLECTRQLKENPSTRDIPIIMASARIQREDVLVGLKPGANQYQVKPIHAEELILRVRSMVTLNRNRLELAHRHREIVHSHDVREEQARGLALSK